MTRPTNRDNVKLMFFIISVWMMINLCLCATETSETGRFGNLSFFNRLVNISASQTFAFMLGVISILGQFALFALLIFFLPSFIGDFEIFSFSILFSIGLAFFAVLPSFVIYFPLFRMGQVPQTNTLFNTNFAIVTLVKLRNWLDLFTFRAGFEHIGIIA